MNAEEGSRPRGAFGHLPAAGAAAVRAFVMPGARFLHGHGKLMAVSGGRGWPWQMAAGRAAAGCLRPAVALGAQPQKP